MSRNLTDLLAMDAMAQRYGCGLNPRLKLAIEADLRFPAKAASPLPMAHQIDAPLPDNVERLLPRSARPPRKQA